MYQTSLSKGQELVAQRMVKEFRRQGHEAYLITSIFHDWEPAIGADEVKRRGGYANVFDDTLGIPVVRVESQTLAWPPRRISFVDFMAKLTAISEDLKLNVLITHSTLWNGPEETLKFVEWRRNQIRGGAPLRPIVFCYMSHFQEPSDDRYDINERSFREAWNKTSLPLIVKGADFVLVTTPYEKEWMRSLGADERKCILFPGGIDSEALVDSGVGPGLRKKYSIPGSVRLISALGTVEERKNAGAILKVAALLGGRQDVHFVVAGRLEGEYGEKVRREAQGLNNVTLTGPVPDEEVPGLIQETYANITMSRSEALGLAQLEFMYAGVPVITSGVGGQAWVVKDGVNGVVLQGPDDLQGAAQAIVDLVERPAHRDKLGDRAGGIASLYTMPRLVSKLSRTILKRLEDTTGGAYLAQELKSTERVLEAWVMKGYSVAATTSRLVVSTARGKNTITIAYDDILKVTRKVRVRWMVLVVGLAATGILVAVRAAGLPVDAGLSSALMQAASRYFSPAGVSFLDGAVPFVPLAVAGVVFALTVRNGYTVSYGEGKSIFLPGEFAKALKFADELTLRSILPAE